MPHFAPSKKLLTDLSSCPGDVTIAQHIAVIAQLLAELSLDRDALNKAPATGEWPRKFRAKVIALKTNQSLDHYNVLHVLGATIEEITRFMDAHGR